MALQDTSILSIPKPYATSEFGQVAGRGNGCGSWIGRCLQKFLGPFFFADFGKKKSISLIQGLYDFHVAMFLQSVGTLIK